MRGKRDKLFISTAKVLLWGCAAFIMLSVAVSERQCYWCGPLAEQVHRSRRAPSCDIPTAHMTTCEAGLMHCAIVATSPPHVESRFCVKLYQDECYPLFCNSTRTWKMTCPCRGNLCNGNNTDRELEAFAVLSKLVAKSQNIRIKKRASSESNFISNDRERTLIITNMTQLQLNQTEHEVNEIGNSERMIVVTSAVPEEPVKELSTENPSKKTVEVNLTSDMPDFSQKLEQPNHTTDTTFQGVFKNDFEDLTTAIPNTDLNITTNVSTITDKPYTMEIAETTKATNMIEETEKVDNDSVKEPETTKESDTNDTIKEANIEKHTTNLPKPVVIPSEQLPTAEALQQNASPSPTTPKTTEIVKADSTEPSTIETDNSTTVEPPKDKASYIGSIPTYLYATIFALLQISH